MGNVSKTEIRLLVTTGIGVIVTAIQLFQASDPYGLKVLLLLVSVCLLPRMTKWSCVDVTVTLLWGYDLLLCFTSVNPMSSLWVACIATQHYLTYLLFRQVVNYSQGALWLRKGLLVVMCTGVGLALASFGIFRRSILEAGFTCLYPFRFLFRPLGYNSNVWTTVLLCTAGMAASFCPSKGLYRWGCNGLLLFTLLGLLLSFSRGTYLSLGLFLLLLWIAFSSLKDRLRLLLLVSMAVGIVVGCFGSEVLDTLRMNHTVSQQQSTQGRFNATRASLKVFRTHPLLGVGMANYTLAIDKELNQDTTQVRTSYPPNWVAQVLVEKGIVGMVLYAVLLGCLAWCLWKGRKRQTCRIVGCTLLAVALKEMTLSTLLSTPITMTLACLLIACLQQGEKKADKVVSPWKCRISRGVLTVCLICYVGREGGELWLSVQATRCEEAKVYISKRDYAGAEHNLERMGQSVPVLVNKGMLNLERCREEQNPKYAEAAEVAFSDAYRKQSEDICIGYLLATARFFKGEKEKAITNLKKLVYQYPCNALYLYTLSQWLYEKGEKREASDCLETAICLVPRLLLSDHIQQWKEKDSCFWNQMEERLMDCSPSETSLPSDFARYGFIAYQYGNINQAIGCLSHAVSIMPSLSTPWLLLGKIHREQGRKEEAESYFSKYRLLSYGAFASGTVPSDSLQLPVFHDNDLLKDYALKFKEWYQYDLFLMRR